MRRVIIILLTFSVLHASLPMGSLKAAAQESPIPSTEPVSGSVVCPPGVYPEAPDDCLTLGPSTYLAQLAADGFPDPMDPNLKLPAFPPPVDLNDTPYRYFRVTNEGVPLYNSLDAAKAHQAYSQLDPGTHLFVSYIDGPIVTTGGATFYQLRSGAWIPADGARQGRFNPPFQGLQFSSQPRNSFGWVLEPVQTRSAPGLNSPETGHILYRFDIVQVYTTLQVDNVTWNLVAPDEWLEATKVARVDPHTNPPTGVTGNRWIEVNLFEQTLSVYDNYRLVYATLTSTGVSAFWTRPGLFQIYIKKLTETMSGSTEADRSDYYYLEDVPWTMYFDEQRALHGAYWHNRFGYPMSHGCVNLSVGDAHWLYDWANINDYVYVYDPSGKTPTDSASSGAGAP